MKLNIYHFFAKEIQNLGHVLSTTGIRPLPSITAAINLMKPPKNAKQVRAFLLSCLLLLQVHQEFCSDSKTSHSPYSP